ncbi:MAG: hypothetical protein M1832_004374 [Thelocarpon impressellum]|nr:MAG: hypothetical protein M1832_004374 [Thelocarpon impressellum]
MVTSTQSSSASSSVPTPATFNGCYDPLDVDSFINYDQLRCPSPSLSPTSSRSQLSRRSTSASVNPNNTLLPATQLAAGAVSPQAFSGPSHQYDLHKQQTGLPVGSLASTLAVNQANSLNIVRSQSGFGAGVDEVFFGANNVDDFLDFNSTPSHNPSLSAASDMDMEFDPPAAEPLPAFFFPERPASTAAEFVDPSAIGVQESQSVRPSPAAVAPPHANTVGRLWPGMHQQQAAMAKAQQQKQLQRQPQPSVVQSSRPSRAGAHHATDPLVEERISRLLSSMRQASVASSNGDGNGSNDNELLPHIARMRKEEEDMDEDERLLASEQGKKLSSKERRQLRNKVSARAFRSRRKEYIGQLEGEVAQRTNEANDFKAENRALREENTRLSDLTRMLLSSSAFSTFLDDLSASGMRPPTTAAEQSAAPAEAPRQVETIQPNTRKDADPFAVAQAQLQAQQQGGAQVGMTLLPDATMDMASLDLDGSGSWALGSMGAGTWGGNTSQVFSVLELPQGPAVDRIDAQALSGKSSNSVGSHFASDESKELPAAIERMPAAEADTGDEKIASRAAVEPVEFDDSDPAFALFADAPAGKHSEDASAVLFDGLSPEKVFARFELVGSSDAPVEDGNVGAATMETFRCMCDSVEAAFQRIDRLTAHLP